MVQLNNNGATVEHLQIQNLNTTTVGSSDLGVSSLNATASDVTLTGGYYGLYQGITANSYYGNFDHLYFGDPGACLLYTSRCV